MKYFYVILILIFSVISGNRAAAQGNGQNAAQARDVLNEKDLEGKWKIDHIDVRLVMPGGKEEKSAAPGGPNEYFEISNGKMTSSINNEIITAAFTMAGNDLIMTEDGNRDTLHITTLTKTICVFNQKAQTTEGAAEMTINLKR